MPANWYAFRASIGNFFAGQNSSGEEATAEAITAAYELAVSQAEDILTRNKLILSTANREGFKNHILNGMNAAKRHTKSGEEILTLSNAINLAATTYWTGAMITSIYIGMPPGHTRLIPPGLVLNPGICNYVQPSLSPVYGNSASTIPTAMARAFKAHLLTIAGLHTLIKLPSPGPPYPLPWAGLI